MSFDYRERKRLVEAVREACRDRGCICGERASVTFISEGPPRPLAAIEHLSGCPLWQDRSLDELPPDAEPDEVIAVDMNGAR